MLRPSFLFDTEKCHELEELCEAYWLMERARDIARRHGLKDLALSVAVQCEALKTKLIKRGCAFETYTTQRKGDAE